ncbi:cell division protein FtsZ [Magnetospirillum gryphiswaldense]|uniref:Cell division protein FtsZ n=1 Tax=Magnetospirillum gryphiswaldense (strain DSM 6361 / JCM 21280 / NBRC 15271 / MSR-1) TaxID=431944 RepID=FTSZ_MAGGM|nr:cell division protein FtsZ [Magnetospirillum gryphiswaldense]V6F5E5.1 RecName: Full=Cell division protein FtsZ [Magnetospirillum gryphiswaldense MSR-1]AVM76268.1 Cell division protein FtsZ [Magnetospirillum gryphiswaldense MSR-1]AVM80171.1 Cell division protein FtsZ [Magnetospirillum gryphiswaldense]CDK99718.1 cell division protein FtsZ [Magnetospirillum gryphiswaldense MSR-1 v2]
MLNFLPGNPQDLKPKITVIGVGGAGGNAVNNMIASRLEGVEFIVANTDAQAINQSRTERRVQLGTTVAQGLGAGSRPEIGRAAAEESLEEVIGQIAGANMVFITAGMGGGTGSGAAPVIARAARDHGILTVGVVTKPFHFEGAHRMRTAEGAIEELSQYVDTLIIIPNQNLFRVATERTTFADAFKMADDVLYSGVRGVTDLMIMPGLINLDFADIRTVMSEMGKAMMGTGEAEGDKRAIEAAEAAISNPLLDDTSMKGAKGVLINITGGMDMTLFEVDEAANRIRDEVDPEANIIFGSTFDEKLNGKMRVSVVATGIASEAAAQPKPTVVSLNTPQAQPQPRVAAGGTAGAGFRPAVVTAQAAPAAAVAVAQAQPQMEARTVAQPAPQPAHQPVVTAQVRVQPAAARPAQQPMAETFRPDPQLRLDPVLERPVPATTSLQADFRADPDMGHLSQAVSHIAETAQAAPQPQRQPEIQRQQAPQPQRQPEPEARRSGGLFGLLRRPAAAQPAPQPQRHEPAPMAQQPRQEPARMGNMATRSEPSVARAGEDLDIPAFLRRQAN